MRPQPGYTTIHIPLTFERGAKPQGLGKDKFIITGLIILGCLLISIVALFLAEGMGKVLIPLIVFAIGTTIARFLVMREHYFNKKRNELLEQDFRYPYSVFWGIYEVSNSYPYICRYINGLKAVFITFDKDVIVGRDEDNDFSHYEAISNAYQQMHKRNINCVHIDYMETVGKDTRTNCLFDMANNAENTDLREVLVRIFDNVEGIMQSSYADYDVYCFLYAGKDELFLDELNVVIDQFMEANYIRYRILSRDAISALVKSVFNLENFSARDTSEKLFLEQGGSHYLKPIWVQRGEVKKILNKTTEEKQEIKNVAEAERNVRKNRKDGLFKSTEQKVIDAEVIDLFSEESIQYDIPSENSVDAPTPNYYAQGDTEPVYGQQPSKQPIKPLKMEPQNDVDNPNSANEDFDDDETIDLW